MTFVSRNAGNRRHHESDHRQTERMRENGPVAAFPGRKGANKLQNPVPEINRKGQDSAELDDDRVHLPKAVVQIETEYGFNNPEVRGRANRQKFRQPLDDSEKEGEQIIVHNRSVAFVEIYSLDLQISHSGVGDEMRRRARSNVWAGKEKTGKRPSGESFHPANSRSSAGKSNEQTPPEQRW